MAASERGIIAVCLGVIFCMSLLLMPSRKTLRTSSLFDLPATVDTPHHPPLEPQALSQAQIDQCQAQLKAVVAGTHNEDEVSALMAKQQELQRQLNAWHKQNSSNIHEGHTGQMHLQQRMYMLLASIPCVRTVCEIGFNGGHSATVWVAAREDIHLVSFDLGEHDYVYTAMRFYTKTRPGRITQTLGDSHRTLPRTTSLLAKKCDIVVVDGNHAYEGAATDIKNMKALANPDFNIFIIDDVFCSPHYCIGPNKALQEAVDGKVLRLLYHTSLDGQGNVVPSSTEHLAVRGFAVGTYL